MPRTQSVTMNDVARAAGVSLKTVSNVVNDYPYMRPSTRQRVEDAIAELGYQVNTSARNLRQGRTGAIKLALAELRNPYFAELAESIMAAAEQRGLTVMVELHRGVRELEEAVLRDSRERQVDGVIYSPVLLGQADADLFSQVGFPLVILGETIFDAPVDHVSMQNIEGAQAAVDHLLSIGRRRIGLIGHNPAQVVSSSALRYKGASRALARAGIEIDPRLVATNVLWNRAGGVEGMARLLDAGEPLDAVMAFNDTLALGALHMLAERGVSVPDDIAVIGFDNIEESAYTRPTLTTIDPGRDQIAAQAVELLCQRMGLKPDGSVETGPRSEVLERAARIGPREILSDFSVVTRESTGF